MPAVTITTVSAERPQQYEDKHVHDVYDEIAPHFSSTRYKPWPIIAAFLSSLPPGAVGLDSGTGNGKYLPLPLENPGRIWTIGLDRSRNLLEIARRAGGNDMIREVVWGDLLGRSWRDGAFVSDPYIVMPHRPGTLYTIGLCDFDRNNTSSLNTCSTFARRSKAYTMHISISRTGIDLRLGRRARQSLQTRYTNPESPRCCRRARRVCTVGFGRSITAIDSKAG